MIEKELKDISLDITEPEYRAMPELSYSNLSTYERLGFDGLDKLFDKLDTPSLLFGSCVDTMLTDGMDEFNNRFRVMDVNVTDSGVNICKALLALDLPYRTFDEIPETVVSETAKRTGFWQADKWDKVRYREVLKTGNIAEFYDSLVDSEKTVVDTQTYEDALNCVRTLRTSPSTSGYFADDDLSTSIRRYYQLKFRADLEDVGYRSMMDLVIVDYARKVIYPCDLKTCGVAEWNFMENFMKYHYYIQARLYWRVLRYNLDKDPYFKDFDLQNFRFIVINRRTLTPLVWEFPLTKEYGSLIDDRGNEVKDPFVLGKELRYYLDKHPNIPNGITTQGRNVITCLKKPEK